MSKKKMFTQNDELVEFAAAIKTISDEEMEAKRAAIAEQEAEDTARAAGRRPIRVVEDAETATEPTDTVVAYDGTEYEVPADDVYTDRHDRTHRVSTARKGDKADHEARKAAYAALKGYHDSGAEWRRDFANLKRLTKYGQKKFGDYRYVADILAYRRLHRLSYGIGYDPYYHGDRFAKPVLVGNEKAADALLEDIDIHPQDIGSLWDKTRDDLYEVIEMYDFDDDGYEIIVQKELPKGQFKTSCLTACLFREADGINQELRRDDEDPEALEYIDDATDILEEVIGLIP